MPSCCPFPQSACQLSEALGVLPPGSLQRICDPNGAMPTAPPTLDTIERDKLTHVAKKLHYSFNQPALLKEALTHCSVPVPPCYQRLELLGDAILDLLVSQHIWISHPHGTPGKRHGFFQQHCVLILFVAMVTCLFSFGPCYWPHKCKFIFDSVLICLPLSLRRPMMLA